MSTGSVHNVAKNTKKGRSKPTEKHATGSLSSQEAQAQILTGQKGGHRPLSHKIRKRKRPHEVSAGEEEEEDQGQGEDSDSDYDEEDIDSNAETEEEDDDEDGDEGEEEDEGRTAVHGMIPNIRSSISCQLIIASRSHPSFTSGRSRQ